MRSSQRDHDRLERRDRYDRHKEDERYRKRSRRVRNSPIFSLSPRSSLPLPPLPPPVPPTPLLAPPHLVQHDQRSDSEEEGEIKEEGRPPSPPSRPRRSSSPLPPPPSRRRVTLAVDEETERAKQQREQREQELDAAAVRAMEAALGDVPLEAEETEEEVRARERRARIAAIRAKYNQSDAPPASEGFHEAHEGRLSGMGNAEGPGPRDTVTAPQTGPPVPAAPSGAPSAPPAEVRRGIATPEVDIFAETPPEAAGGGGAVGATVGVAVRRGEGLLDSFDDHEGYYRWREGELMNGTYKTAIVASTSYTLSVCLSLFLPLLPFFSLSCSLSLSLSLSLCLSLCLSVCLSLANSPRMLIYRTSTLYHHDVARLPRPRPRPPHLSSVSTLTHLLPGFYVSCLPYQVGTKSTPPTARASSVRCSGPKIPGGRTPPVSPRK